MMEKKCKVYFFTLLIEKYIYFMTCLHNYKKWFISLKVEGSKAAMQKPQGDDAEEVEGFASSGCRWKVLKQLRESDRQSAIWQTLHTHLERWMLLLDEQCLQVWRFTVKIGRCGWL